MPYYPPPPTSESVPPGVVQAYAGSSAPPGYLLCDGAEVSRTTYADLFAVIGTTYGAGDGSTTFNVPNLKGRVPVGIDSGQSEFDVLGETGGAKTHTLSVSEIPPHNHNATFYSGSGVAGNFAAGGSTSIGTSGANISNTGGGGAHNNLQPYLVMNFIIKT